MKDTPWFRHDQNAGDDEKMIAMRADYGWAGSGWYWRIVEYMRGEEGYRIFFTNKLLIGKIAGNLNLTKEKFIKFISDCCTEYFLFEKDDEKFWSNSLHRRMSAYTLIGEKRSAAGKLGMERRYNKASENNNKGSNLPNKASENMPFVRKKYNKGSENLTNEGRNERKNARAREENSSNDNSGASPPEDVKKYIAEAKKNSGSKSKDNTLENLIPQALEEITL